VTLHWLFPNRWSRALGVAALVLALSSLPGLAMAAGPAGRAAVAASQADNARSDVVEAHDAGEGWGATIWKIVNFAILAGGLWYFLRTPISGYLRSRDDTIRRDLVEAASLRASAEQQLAEVRARLAALPGELDALRRRGAEELVAERARMHEASTRARDALLERARREIDLHFRLARRELLAHTADLATQLARTRIASSVTPDDQTRLVDRYAAEVRL
jgi:F-type H+-transporting ATPase subunit b